MDKIIARDRGAILWHYARESLFSSTSLSYNVDLASKTGRRQAGQTCVERGDEEEKCLDEGGATRFPKI